MRIEDLLPIGSVVLLKGAEKKLMIFGVKQTSTENDDEEFDYIGVMYPEGSVGAEYQFLFNHEDIDQIVFKGYQDEERIEFISKLADYYNSPDTDE